MIKFICRRLFYTLLLVCSISACTPQFKFIQGPFLKLSAIETELKKGVSTKMDVQRILGAPQGFGGAVFPVTAEAHEIWFYQNIVYDNIQFQTSPKSLDMNQKVLLVFFTKGLFDGFLWYTGTVKGSIQ